MRGVRFKHWLSGYEFAPKIEDEQMAVLLCRVRDGDKQAIKAMIEGHLRLANSVVSRYLRSKPADPDVLVSAAWFAVTYAVNRIAAGHLTHDNPSGYIMMFLHRYLHAALNDQPVIKSPCDSVNHIMCHQLRSEHDQPVQPDTSMEVEEKIEYLANDETDIEIIRLLRRGHIAADVAYELGLHPGNVSRRIRRIRKTYLELINE